MSSSEVKTTIILAVMMSMRMLGLFMILPVFAIYALELEGANSLWVGLAVGAYGLTQAVLQIPFGRLSDRFGRKPMIYFGLVLFIIGSLVAGFSDSIVGVTIGRALQGAGAIASVVMALASDLVSDENRTKAMAILGMSIGLSFCLAMVLGPLFTDHLGLQGLFFLIAAMGFVGILINGRLPTPIVKVKNRENIARTETLQAVLKNRDLMILNAGILILHMTMTSFFLVIPVVLNVRLSLPVAEHWIIYLPILFVSFLLMIPAIIYAEAKRKIRLVFRFAIALLAFSLLLSALLMESGYWLLLAIVLFFWAFNMLEALLPSMVAKFAPAMSKGSAMGVYSSSQFFGAFLGGGIGGWVIGDFGNPTLLLVLMFCVLLWLVIAFGLSTPLYAQTLILHLERMSSEQGEVMVERFLAEPGVEEATVIAQEGVAYLKVSKREVSIEQLKKFSVLGS